MATAGRLRFDTSDVQRAMQENKRRFPKAVRRALNRAATSARLFAVSNIAKKYRLKSGVVRSRLKIQQATETRMTSTVYAAGRPLRLIHFPHRGPRPSRGRGRGVVAMNGTVQYPHAFIATMPNGKEGIFLRTGRNRLPIEQLYGPSYPELFAEFMDGAKARGEEALEKNLASELNFAAAIEGQ